MQEMHKSVSLCCPGDAILYLEAQFVMRHTVKGLWSVCVLVFLVFTFTSGMPVCVLVYM